MTADMAATLNSDVLSCETSQPSTSASIKKGKDKPPPEYCVLIVGTHHKQPLVEKLLSSAEKFERHIQYQDTVYLYVNIQGDTAVVELNDPGLEHTGAREMAVRKAEAIILFYAAYNAASFHQLSSIAEDFKSRKNGSPPVLLICNEDEILEDDEEDNTAATHSSTSEGYESLEEHEHVSPSPSHQSQRRRSMEKIRKSHEEQCPITSEQGEDMAKLFGTECEFLSLSLSKFQEASQLIDRLITRIRANAPENGRSRPKERSQSILKIKRRQSIPHPLKLFTNHSGEDKSSPKKSTKNKKSDKVTQREHSSSSSRESIEKSDSSGFLSHISNPPRRSKSMNIRGAGLEEHETHFGVGEGGYRGTAKNKISKKLSANRAEDSDLNSNPASSPTSMYRKHTPISNCVHEFGSNDNNSLTASLSVHRLVIDQENEERGQEAHTKQQRNGKTTENESAEGKSSETGGKKKNWSFRRVGKVDGEKSAACVIS